MILVFMLAVIAALLFFSWRDRLRFLHIRDMTLELGGLEKAALRYSGDLEELRDIIVPNRKSALSKREAIIWVKELEHGTVFLTTSGRQIKAWLRLDGNLRPSTHIVLDATKNNHTLSSNLARTKLPSIHYDLEGNFPDYFKLYYNKGQQILALQILTPDVMEDLLLKLKEFDLEITGNSIGLITKFFPGTNKQLDGVLSLMDRLALIASSIEAVYSED